MRVSTNMHYRSAQTEVGRAMSRFHGSQAEMASGKRVRRPSDDPVSAKSIMMTERELATIEQYKRNASIARSRVQAEESALNQVVDIIMDARDLALAEVSQNRNAVTRAAGKAVVDRLLDQVIGIANTKVGNDFIFAGSLVSTAPFSATGVYSGDNVTGTVEVKKDYVVTPNQDGETLFINSDVIQSLSDLSTALGANNLTGISTAIDLLNGSFDKLQSLLADAGGRVRQMDSVDVEHVELKHAFTSLRSESQDVDLAEAYTRYMADMNAMQAAILAASKAVEFNGASYFA